MKAKKEYIILILIIAGLSVYLFVRSSDRALYQLPELTELKQNEITRIEILKDKDSIILKKKEDQWYLEPGGYLADSNQVKGMLSVLKDLTLTALVSESEDYHRYDLHPEKRITIKAWQEGTLKRNFDIGKAAPSFRHTFVKLGDDSRVFHARSSFRPKFDQTAESLRDKTVLSFKTTDIQEIQITKDQTSVKLIRNQVPVKAAASQPEKSDNTPPVAVKYEWRSGDGEKANDQNLNQLLATLGSLKCANYINDRSKDSFAAPIYSVRLKGDRDYQLNIFAKLQADDQNYPAVSSASDYPFFLSDPQVQQIMKDPSEFLKNHKDAEKKAGQNKALKN